MKFLADENFPKPLVRKIQSLGFSVRTVQQKSLQGSSDKLVAQIAYAEGRIILTFDRNFLKGKVQEVALIIFNFPRVPTEEITPLVEYFITDLRKVNPAKKKVFKFNKNGLEEIKRV